MGAAPMAESHDVLQEPAWVRRTLIALAALAMLALVVVLPTPPLPEVTTMISAKVAISVWRVACGCQDSSAKRSLSSSSQTCTALPRRSFGISSSTL